MRHRIAVAVAAVGAVEALDVFVAEARPAHADGVKPADEVRPVDLAVRRHVVVDAGGMILTEDTTTVTGSSTTLTSATAFFSAWISVRRASWNCLASCSISLVISRRSAAATRP